MNKAAAETDYKRERDRFVALAFCRADMLIELDDAHAIVFSAGATAVLGGATPDSLIGRPFLDHVAESHRAPVRDLLAAVGTDGRIDDVIIELAGPGGRAVPATLAGYRVPDFDNHYFLALKVKPAAAHRLEAAESPRTADGGLVTGESFGQAAAAQVRAFNRAGGRGQVSLVRVQNVDKLAGSLGGEGKRTLMTHHRRRPAAPLPGRRHGRPRGGRELRLRSFRRSRPRAGQRRDRGGDPRLRRRRRGPAGAQRHPGCR